MVKPRPFHIAETLERYPFRVEPHRMGHDREYPTPAPPILGSFSSHDGNGSEKVSFKMNSRFFQSLSRLFQFAENGKCRRISLELISWGPHSSLEREKEIRRRLFTSSIKLAIRHFHVVAVQGR